MYAGHGKRPVLSRVPTHFRPEAPRSRRKTLCFQYGGCLGRAQICLLTANSGLDVLAEHGDAVEQAVFWRAADLFRLDVDLVFYDATTAWFETDEEDVAAHEWRGLTFAPLRRRGHSKEGRDYDPQVVIALAVTRDGVPVRSWGFPGATPDVTTVRTIKDDLRAMRLGRVLFVGDAGLYSRANLDELAEGAGRYVLAAPVGRVGEIRDE